MLFLIHFRFTQFLGLALWVGQLGVECSVMDKHFLEVWGGVSVHRKSSCQCLKMPPCSQNCENCILNFNHGIRKITVFSPTLWTVFLNKPVGSSNISNQSEIQLIRKDFHRGLTNSHMCLIGQTVVGIFINVEHNVRIYSHYLEMSNTMLEFILTICFQISWFFFQATPYRLYNKCLYLCDW